MSWPNLPWWADLFTVIGGVIMVLSTLRWLRPNPTGSTRKKRPRLLVMPWRYSLYLARRNPRLTVFLWVVNPGWRTIRVSAESIIRHTMFQTIGSLGPAKLPEMANVPRLEPRMILFEYSLTQQERDNFEEMFYQGEVLRSADLNWVVHLGKHEVSGSGQALGQIEGIPLERPRLDPPEGGWAQALGGRKPSA